MDEWAALAAAEGDEEPIELQNYDPDAIYAHFKRRPLVLLRRGLRSGSLLGGYGFRLWLDHRVWQDGDFIYINTNGHLGNVIAVVQFVEA